MEIIEGTSKVKQNPLKCEICGEIFKSKHNLAQHSKACQIYGKLYKKIHPNTYVCLKCPEKVSVKQLMYSHIKRKHLEENQPKSEENSSENTVNKANTGKDSNESTTNKSNTAKDSVEDTVNKSNTAKNSFGRTVKKKCETCQESFIGAEKIVQEQFYQHIKTKHLPSGLNVQIMPLSDQTDSYKERESKKVQKSSKLGSLLQRKDVTVTNMRKYEFCGEQSLNTNFEKHFDLCKIYEKLIQKTTQGFSCSQCSETMKRRDLLVNHIKSSHSDLVKKMEFEQKSEEIEIIDVSDKG